VRPHYFGACNPHWIGCGEVYGTLAQRGCYPSETAFIDSICPAINRQVMAMNAARLICQLISPPLRTTTMPVNAGQLFIFPTDSSSNPTYGSSKKYRGRWWVKWHPLPEFISCPLSVN